MKFISIALFILPLASCTKSKSPTSGETKIAHEATCQTDTSTCSSVDIEHPKAKESYEFGCTAKDGYSCYRLGQFFETKAQDSAAAIKSYEQSCTYKYEEGCQDEKELRSKLCYLEKKTEFCKGEPEGEYRILVFLEKLDPKYKDAFIKHDFSYDLKLQSAQELFAKRFKEKNVKLLEALKLAQTRGHHDGDDAETLQRDIWILEGHEHMLDSVE